MNLNSKRIDWIKDSKFWCNECDDNVIDSADSNTGHFYMMFGHIYKPSHKVQDYGMPSSIGDSTSIIFAICHQCENQ